MFACRADKLIPGQQAALELLFAILAVAVWAAYTNHFHINATRAAAEKLQSFALDASTPLRYWSTPRRSVTNQRRPDPPMIQWTRKHALPRAALPCYPRVEVIPNVSHSSNQPSELPTLHRSAQSGRQTPILPQRPTPRAYRRVACSPHRRPRRLRNPPSRLPRRIPAGHAHRNPTRRRTQRHLLAPAPHPAF